MAYTDEKIAKIVEVCNHKISDQRLHERQHDRDWETLTSSPAV